MIELYKKWQPLEGIDNELSIEAIHDDYEGLRIILIGRAPGSGILRITFSHYYMYRNVNESNRVRLWNEANFEDRNWSLFQATSSKLLDWLHEESGQAFDEIDMTHYLIKTSMEVVDVITVIAHPRHELVHYAASTEPPARQVRMAAKALRPRSIPVSITEQTAA